MEKETKLDWAGPYTPFALVRGEARDFYLGNPKVVEAMIRNAMGRIYSDRQKEVEGGTPENGPQYVTTVIASTVQALLGRQNAYTPISDVWNSSEPGSGIMRSVEDSYGLSGQSPSDTVAWPFYLLLETAMEAEELAAKGEDWEHLIDGDIEKMVAAFTGTPYSDR